MPTSYQGIVAPSQLTAVTPQTFFGIMINWFAPRCPLLGRLPKVPEGNNIFNMVGHHFRPRTVGIGATGFVNATDTTTTLTDVADGSSIMAGDVFKTAVGEYVEVTVDPTPGTPNTVTFRRGVAGSTKTIQAASTNMTLVGNTRTGAEDFPQSVTSAFTAVTQYMQTIQHPYSVGGGVQSNTAVPLQPGAATPLDQYRMDATQNWMDDAEMSAYIGKAESVSSSSSGRQKMGGLRNLLTTNFQTGSGITDYTGYKAVDFQRDLLTRPRKSGGQPDVVVVASNWMDAFATWSFPLQLITQGDDIFGRPIRQWAAPFLGDVSIWEASLLPDYTAFSLTSREVRWRVKRPLVDEPLAKTGDVQKGQMIGELAIEVDNEAHHAWVDGISAFAA